MREPIKPRERTQADHRVIARILELSHGQKSPDDSLLEKISRVYIRRGGSWVLFFEGHPDHNKLLKRVISAVVNLKRKQHDQQRRRDRRQS